MIEQYSKPIKLIIVEDDKMYRNVLEEFFQSKSDFKVVGTASDGQTAIYLTKEKNPDVVIMDLGLPVMQGKDAIKKIKEIDPTIKIVVLTAHIDEDEAIESIAAGATAYVNKDINIQHLNTIIQTVNNGAVWLSPLIGYKILEKGIKHSQK
ncbi:MAG: hypothetical protein A2Y25_04865 [Candidatus Melainabacteria bacterium GWF2_37_15]|nr:MAG: hypothetical protein A2Y25_04865 [Candidatus Melainabacteria bacterium GWF2_37_15]